MPGASFAGDPLDGFAAIDAELLTVGEAAVFGFWRRLGLTFSETDEQGGYRIDVATPPT